MENRLRHQISWSTLPPAIEEDLWDPRFQLSKWTTFKEKRLYEAQQLTACIEDWLTETHDPEEPHIINVLAAEQRVLRRKRAEEHEMRWRAFRPITADYGIGEALMRRCGWMPSDLYILSADSPTRMCVRYEWSKVEAQVDRAKWATDRGDDTAYGAGAALIATPEEVLQLEQEGSRGLMYRPGISSIARPSGVYMIPRELRGRQRHVMMPVPDSLGKRVTDWIEGQDVTAETAYERLEHTVTQQASQIAQQESQIARQGLQIAQLQAAEKKDAAAILRLCDVMGKLAQKEDHNKLADRAQKIADALDERGVPGL